MKSPARASIKLMNGIKNVRCIRERWSQPALVHGRQRVVECQSRVDMTCVAAIHRAGSLLCVRRWRAVDLPSFVVKRG